MTCIALKNLAIIPARSGSKGLTKKNIRLLQGKPMLAYTIEAAIESACFDRVIVSTDDTETAQIAESYGAEVPYLRPKDLATDTAHIIDVLLHALHCLETKECFFDTITLLQPTSPLRQAEDICHAMALFIKKNADAIISVSEVDHSPLWMNILPPDHNMENFLLPDLLNKRRQQLPVYHRLNGAIYISKTSSLKKNKTFHSKKTYAYVMPRERSIDIDHLIDFKLCETILGNANGI